MPTTIDSVPERTSTPSEDSHKPAPTEGDSKTAKKPQAPPLKTFERGTFINEVGTGKNVGYKDKEMGKTGDTVSISKETEDQYVHFLKDYLNTFSDAIKLNPSLKENKSAAAGIQLVDILTTDGKPDSAKIDKFLKHKEGWIVATEAMNEYALQLNAVLGFVTDSRPPSERGGLLQPEKVKIGGLRSFGWFGRMAGFENPFGAKFVHFNQRVDLFRALKNDPEQKDYIKGVLSINLDDYQVRLTIPPMVEKVPGRLNADNRSPESLRRNVLQLMQARREFLKDLGIPLKSIDSLPEEAILTRRALYEGFGQTGLKWEKEIIDAYKPNEGGYIDWDMAGNVVRFNNARRELMLRYVSEVMIKDALQSPDKIASVVKERTQVIMNEGPRRIAEANKRKAELAAEREEKSTQLVSVATTEEINLVKNIPKNLVETKKAYDDLINKAGATIRPQELEHLTIDKLILLATNPPYNLPNSMPEDQKALREMLLRAKTERLSMQTEKIEQSPDLQKNSFRIIVEPPGATPTINPDNLLTMPEQQLRYLLSQPSYSWNAAQIENSLPLAQQEARRKLIIRYTVSLEERIADLDQQIQAQDKIIESAGNLDKVKETLEITSALLEKQGEIFSRVIAIPREVDRYTNPSNVQNTDTEYSKSEREKALPIAYYEMLNVLFDYQHGGKIADQVLSREEYFKKIYNFLLPDKLLTLIHKSMGITVPSNFTALDPNSFTSNTELLTGFKKMLISLGKEAIAL